MPLADLARLIALAAIWGSSFIFMRILAPLLGPVLTATVRTLAAGLVLTGLFSLLRVKIEWKRDFRHFLIVGLLNSALPFMLFSYAALHIPASVSSIVNALTPLWGAVFAALLLGEAFGLRKMAGIALGVLGVAFIALFGSGSGKALGGGLSASSLLPVLACVLATILYGLSGAYMKRWAKEVPPRAMTAASLLFAGLVLLPLALLAPRPLADPSLGIWLLALLFSLLCSALAYLLYFRLIVSAGVTRALSVTLLIPVFAFIWGFIFLGETIRPAALVGAALVLGGTGLIAGAPKKKTTERSLAKR